MIKFTANLDDNKKLIGIGLSHGNLKRLKDGKSIKINGPDIGLPDMEILIFSGSTEASMAEQLDPYITASTIIHKDRT